MDNSLDVQRFICKQIINWLLLDLRHKHGVVGIARQWTKRNSARIGLLSQLRL